MSFEERLLPDTCRNLPRGSLGLYLVTDCSNICRNLIPFISSSSTVFLNGITLNTLPVVISPIRERLFPKLQNVLIIKEISYIRDIFVVYYCSCFSSLLLYVMTWLGIFTLWDVVSDATSIPDGNADIWPGSVRIGLSQQQGTIHYGIRNQITCNNVNVPEKSACKMGRIRHRR